MLLGSIHTFGDNIRWFNYSRWNVGFDLSTLAIKYIHYLKSYHDLLLRYFNGHYVLTPVGDIIFIVS